MWTRKRVVGGTSVLMFVWLIVLPYIQFWPVLQDEEFDGALLRAESVGIENIEWIQEYPFAPVARKEAAHWYVRFAQDASLLPVLNTCVFEDISSYPSADQETFELSCRYGFFQWVQWSFFPEQRLTKWASITALVRWMMPGRRFDVVQPYREPYVNQAFTMWLTIRPSTPYLEYAITRYELLLQLYRAAQIYHQRE